jgi:hypothetical protein
VVGCADGRGSSSSSCDSTSGSTSGSSGGSSGNTDSLRLNHLEQPLQSLHQRPPRACHQPPGFLPLERIEGDVEHQAGEGCEGYGSNEGCAGEDCEGEEEGIGEGGEGAGATAVGGEGGWMIVCNNETILNKTIRQYWQFVETEGVGKDNASTIGMRYRGYWIL